MEKIALAIHGGAGTILKEEMTQELEQRYRDGLKEALDIGFAVLANGGSSVDAVNAAVIVLEDNMLFNAGCGCVFTKKGAHEMDAAIMDGRNLQAGAVAGVRNVRNPVALATAVMRNSAHIFLSGDGANEFAVDQGLKTEPDEYFFSESRFAQWKSVCDSEDYKLDHSHEPLKQIKQKKFGTVGAVACDVHGNIAAATSTGGITNKSYGRIGDSPLIGCGTYANNKTCAISCTGHGEMFIRTVAAHDVSCLMEYKGMNLHDSMHKVVWNKLVEIDGEGGMIGVDSKANIEMIFNTAGMYRAAKNNEGYQEIAIYK
jgi:beta-aspartyl-peptidase (threonine type)